MTTNSYRLLYLSTLAIIALMPFHAFGVIWVGTAFDHSPLINLWKEDLIVFVMSVPAIYLLIKDSELRKFIFTQRFNLFVGLYALVNVVFFFYSPLPLEATAAAIKINLIFLIFFVLAQIAFYKAGKPQATTLCKVILIPATVVGLLAILQVTALPPGFLASFGYGRETIEPVIFIKDSPIPRAFGTTSGPNQLGAYLLLPLFLGLLEYSRRRTRWLFYSIALIAVAIVASFSRSAWIAVFVGLVFLYWRTFWPKHKRLILFTIPASIILLAGLIYLAPKIPVINNLLLHGDRDITHESLLEGSTAGHIRAFEPGAEQVAEEPLGSGLGSAGPASFLTEDPLITENYYLQLAVELGILGLILFIAIKYSVGKRLYDLRQTIWGKSLFASLLGLIFANILLHTWADSTTALVWWGTAGAYLGLSAK